MTDDHLRATISQKAALFGPDGDVLLLRQRGDDTWDVPGGRIGAGEDVVAGIRREVREATGLDVDVGRPVHTETWMTDDGEGRYAVVYACTTDQREVDLSDEHRDWRWTDPETAVEDLLSESELRPAIERAVETQTATR